MKASDILLVDDERIFRESFSALLTAEGFSVRTARDGDEALAAFRAERPDLVLLDVMMPNKNGLAVCSEIRAFDALTPILFITAMPSEVSLVRGLGQGADDYMAKDAPREEILARIRTALRRTAALAAAKPNTEGLVTIGDVTVDFKAMCVWPSVGLSSRDRRAAPRESLTKSEGQLLRLLLGEPGRVFSNDAIFAALHGEGYVGDDIAIRVLVLRLKRKLGRAGERIVNERGLGYRFVR